MKSSLRVTIILAALLSVAQGATAATENSVSTSAGKAPRPYGGTVGLGSPFPGLLGINVHKNLTADWRATAGYSEIEVTTGFGPFVEKVKATTIALGAQRLFTDWAVRPVVGLHAGYFKVKATKGAEIDMQGFDKSTALAYSNMGIDWTSQSGFNMGTGMNVGVAGGSGASFYANIGRFF
jgi:hypothetical protein